MEFIIANKVVLLAFAFALSEVLAIIPSIKANSVFQLAANFLKKIAGK